MRSARELAAPTLAGLPLLHRPGGVGGESVQQRLADLASGLLWQGASSCLLAAFAFAALGLLHLARTLARALQDAVLVTFTFNEDTVVRARCVPCSPAPAPRRGLARLPARACSLGVAGTRNQSNEAAACAHPPDDAPGSSMRGR